MPAWPPSTGPAVVAARRPHHGHRWLAALAVAATSALTACAGGSPASPTPPATTTTTLAASAPVSPPVSTAVHTVGADHTPAATAPTPGTVDYPTNARAYSIAAVSAWVAGDHTRLGQLTTGAGTHIFETLSTGDPDRHFDFANCQGAAGSSYCVFYNGTGDMLRLRLSRPQLGRPHAIAGGRFEPTTFPDDNQEYAQEALDAWRADNTARLGLLTTTDAYQHILATPVGQTHMSWTFDHSEGAAGSFYLTWTNEAGDSLVFRFVNPDVDPSGGPQHRIVDILFLPHS